MAASSERSPPPFPELEDQELEPELEDEDSDEGADIFTGSTLSSMDPPLPVSTSEPDKDIFSGPRAEPLNNPLSETAAEQLKAVSGASSKAKGDVPVEEAGSEEPDDLFSDPLGESGAELETHTSNAPLLDFSEEPPKSDPIKKAASSVAAEKKVLHTDLFGDGVDDDEDKDDLFKTPPGAMMKKPQASLFRAEPDDIFPEAKTEAKPATKASAKQPNNAPTDLFTEEPFTVMPAARAAVKPAAIPSANTSSKTNGLHSDEEDLFAEATVELSLDSPRNDRRKRDAMKPSEPVPCPSTSTSSSKPQPKKLEELEEEEKEDKFDLNISVTNPEKTTLSMFRSKQLTVRRRFSDFLGLYEKLSEKHSPNGYIVPPAPEKSILGMTKVKVGKEDLSSDEFVERRRAALERYLQRVVSHPSLLQDPDVREFLEKEELPRAVSTQALSGAGFLKMINKATDAVSKMTIKMNESDVWFEEKLQEVESEDQQLRKLHGMVESLVNHRKELSVNTAVFAKSVAMLGSSEDNTALSRALSQLAEVEDRIEQLHQDQAANDFFIFAELLADYIRLLGAVRACFDQRMKAWQRWQDGQNMLQKKREAEAKLLWANKPEKLQQAKDEIGEWEGRVSQYERDFDRVSATVRKEVMRFEKEKTRDFKKQIIKYLQSLLHSEQQLIKYWEAFLPEAKAIA
uniref:Sorting nexin-2 n=1 Tax=Electrophorus electricus TaxID=8005 RepID=A0A4W4GMR7_ELEEL